MSKRRTWMLLAASFSTCSASFADVEGHGFRQQVESDWLLRERFRAPVVSRAMTPELDAAAAVDGVKDGSWGFHTSLDGEPWWQVDLGLVVPLDAAVIWNRCDGAMERAAHLSILLSQDGKEWETAYTHDGTTFFGASGGKPLRVALTGRSARFLRVRLPGPNYLHLEEVEVFAVGDPETNVALSKPATQSSISSWSRGARAAAAVDLRARLEEILERARALAADLAAGNPGVACEREGLDRIGAVLAEGPSDAELRALYLEARWIQRRLTLARPMLDFEDIVFVERVPGSFNHMSDQYLGWWSMPGGGIHVLRAWKTGTPRVDCISESFREPGSFLRPALSPDASKILFAWCRHYPGLAGEPNKLDKKNVPEDAFYHVFEMGIDGSGIRQITRGRYDDFDARYLPDGRIVFLSTRRTQAIAAGRASAHETLSDSALGDIYVRCGGGPERPCAVYTLHTVSADGSDIRAISPFEMFEWTPSVAQDGTILYSRWDYIDRDNMPYMSLWASRPDGSNARLIYGNFTKAPHCTFEPMSIPGSRKILFTASAHHAQTNGSLVLLDPAVGTEGAAPIRRLTPEVAFPEIEGWPQSSYTSPWPLSERFSLVAWSCDGAQVPPPSLGWDRWHAAAMPRNGAGLYLFDAEGNMELLYRDDEYSCVSPLPLRSMPVPHRLPAMADAVDPALRSNSISVSVPVPVSTPVASGEDRDSGSKATEGRFLLADVYRGLAGKIPRGEIRSLRIVAVPPKTHPTMNYPSIGVTNDDPGKCVLGTVPVESDGSAYFTAPAGVIVFFQALDARGMALQTMRSVTHVQPGQTLACIGCHESRDEAPARMPVLAARRDPSRILAGPEGSWPFRFDRLVGPVIEGKCSGCHRAGSEVPEAAKFELTSEKAYENLVGYGKPSLRDVVRTGYARGYSIPGEGMASGNPVLAKLLAPGGHHDVEIAPEDLERLATWMDAYGQRLGSFGPDQERRLEDLRVRCAGTIVEMRSPVVGSAGSMPSGEPSALPSGEAIPRRS